jgi:hypothetical protein
VADICMLDAAVTGEPLVAAPAALAGVKVLAVQCGAVRCLSPQPCVRLAGRRASGCECRPMRAGE